MIQLFVKLNEVFPKTGNLRWRLRNFHAVLLIESPMSYHWVWCPLRARLLLDVLGQLSFERWR